MGELTVVIEVEQDGEEDRERYGNEDICDFDVPEMDEPSTILSGEEGLAGRECCKWDILHVPDMDKSSEENDSEWRAVVFNELSYVALEKVAATNYTAYISRP